MPEPPRNDRAPTFEANLQRLETIVHQLENADLPLEKSIELYEEGMKLSRVCHQQLQEAEGKVEVLRKRAGGSMVAEPFEAKETEGS